MAIIDLTAEPKVKSKSTEDEEEEEDGEKALIDLTAEPKVKIWCQKEVFVDFQSRIASQRLSCY